MDASDLWNLYQNTKTELMNEAFGQPVQDRDFNKNGEESKEDSVSMRTTIWDGISLCYLKSVNFFLRSIMLFDT